MDKYIDSFTSIERQCIYAKRKSSSHAYIHKIGLNYGINTQNSELPHKTYDLMLHSIAENKAFKIPFINLDDWCIKVIKNFKVGTIRQSIGLQYINFINSHEQILKRLNKHNAMKSCYTMYRKIKGDNNNETKR